MSKARTSRTVRDGLTDCPCLNSNSKNAKSTVVRVARWAGRTVRRDPADRPPGPPELRTILYVSRLILDCPPCTLGQSARKRFFLKNLAKKPQTLNKLQRPTDRPPQGPGLSAHGRKLIFLTIFNETLSNEITTHLNAMHANS
jgi:hypothetical protein